VREEAAFRLREETREKIKVGWVSVERQQLFPIALADRWKELPFDVSHERDDLFAHLLAGCSFRCIWYAGRANEQGEPISPTLTDFHELYQALQQPHGHEKRGACQAFCHAVIGDQRRGEIGELNSKEGGAGCV
jgi:hypothetical protein